MGSIVAQLPAFAQFYCVEFSPPIKPGKWFLLPEESNPMFLNYVTFPDHHLLSHVLPLSLYHRYTIVTGIMQMHNYHRVFYLVFLLEFETGKNYKLSLHS